MVNRNEAVGLLAFGVLTVLWAALVGNVVWALGGTALTFVASVAVMHAVRTEQAELASLDADEHQERE